MSTLEHLCEAVFQTLFQEAAGHVRKGTKVPAKICLYSATKNGKHDVEVVNISKDFTDDEAQDVLAQAVRKCLSCPEIELVTMTVEGWTSQGEDIRNEECVVINLLTKEFQTIKLCPIDRVTKTLKQPTKPH